MISLNLSQAETHKSSLCLEPTERRRRRLRAETFWRNVAKHKILDQLTLLKRKAFLRLARIRTPSFRSEKLWPCLNPPGPCSRVGLCSLVSISERNRLTNRRNLSGRRTGTMIEAYRPSNDAECEKPVRFAGKCRTQYRSDGDVRAFQKIRILPKPADLLEKTPFLKPNIVDGEFQGLGNIR